MKRIILGDTHGRSFWKLILGTQEWDEVVFPGDYFDSYNQFTPIEEIHNFREIIHLKETCGKRVILLLGNHDIIYIPGTVDPFVSGYDPEKYPDLAPVITENLKHLIMAYKVDNLLFTHAGVSETFLKNTRYAGDNFDDISSHINAIWRTRPEEFMFRRGGDSSGDDIFQSPVWIRPKSLMKDSKNIKNSGIVQIVGHTQQNQIDIKGKATGGKYYFIDTLGTSGEYLIIEDGEFKTGKI